MSEWKEYMLRDVSLRITSGGTPKSSEPKYYDGEIPWLNTKEIHFNYIRSTKRNITELGLQNSSAKWIPKDSVIVAMYGATAAKVAYSLIDLTTNQACCNIIVDASKADCRYVYYYLQSSYDELSNLACGAAQQNLSIGVISDFPILIPSLDEQKRIAGVLSSLDDKMDLLHRENATLEAIAETLFRHYFIENPNPDWKEGKVSDIAIHCKDSINPQKHFDEIFSHYSIPAYDNGKRPTEEQGQNIQSNKYVIPQNCILFSKLNPHKDKRVWLMLDDVQPNAICSTEFQIVKPQNDQWLYFLYEWLTYKENYDEIASGVSGTSGSHQRIDPKVIFDNECPIVDNETLSQYNEQAKPLFKKIKSNQQQTQTLAAQRDNILPRLMSGDMRVAGQ